MATEFEAILLAGGRSERMGQDKARLAWRGRPLIEHMLALLREAGARRVHVSGDRPEHAGIPDAWPGRGPVAGIASVLPHCRDGAVVIVPVDLPLLRPARVRGLVDALRQVSDLKPKDLLNRRYDRLQAYGRFADTKDR